MAEYVQLGSVSPDGEERYPVVVRKTLEMNAREL